MTVPSMFSMNKAQPTMSGTINEGDKKDALEGLAGDSCCRGMMAGDRFCWLIQ